MRQDIVENAETILAAAINQEAEAPRRRYCGNLLVDNGTLTAPPVVYEDDPAHERLVGRVEHRAEMGALTTDFHLIRPGALHRANGR